MLTIIMSVLLAILPPCATEDSTNCAWDATVQGNGHGSSFVDLGSVAFEVAQ